VGPILGHVTPEPDDATVLPEVDDHPEAGADHPDGVTDAEAADGDAVYHQVDDLDDESNGLDP